MLAGKWQLKQPKLLKIKYHVVKKVGGNPIF